MEKDKNATTEQILYHIMEILYLLTGEDYIIVKKPGRQTTHNNRLLVVEGISRTLGNVYLTQPRSKPSQKENDQKILDLTNKIIELLTGEVPIRCDNLTVHFSMEEWEYIEGQKDLYKDILVKKPQDIELLDNPVCNNSLLNNGTSGLLNEDEMTIQTESGTDRLKIHNPQVIQNIASANFTEKISAREDGSIGNVERTNYSSLCIKEEPCDVSCDGRNLSTAHSAVESPSVHIKEEPISKDGGHLTDSISYTPTGDTQHQPYLHTVKEQSSYGGPQPNIYTPTDHAQHHPNPHTVKEQSSYGGQNQTKPNMYPSTHIIEKTVSSERENRTKTGLKRQHPSNHSMEEPTSSNKVPVLVSRKDHVDTKTTSYLTQQSTSTLIKQNKPALRDKKKHKNFTITVEPSVASEHLQMEGEDEKSNSSSVYSVHQSDNSMEILYHCPSCQIGFSSNLELARHQVDHSVDKFFKCSSCGKSFTQLSFLIKHQVIHTDLKLCVCKVCGTCFYSETSLAKHQKSHSLPVHCSTCGKCFFSYTEMEIHKRKHTGEKPFGCHVCGKHFLSKSVLDKHTLCHTKVELSK